jgi:hypothetical protein
LVSATLLTQLPPVAAIMASLRLQELCQKIMAGAYNAPDYLSPGARDLLGRMLTVDPDARITLAEVAAHPWTRTSGLQWAMPDSHCYSLPGAGAFAESACDSLQQHQQQQQQQQPIVIPHGKSSSGAGSMRLPDVQQQQQQQQLGAQPSILDELQGHGYSRPAVLRYLAAGEANYVTASYYLLAEARQEAAQKLLPQKPWPFQPAVAHSSSRGGGSSRSSASRAAAAPGSAAAGSGGGASSSSARPASGPGGSSSSSSRHTPAGAPPYAPRPATAIAAPVPC